MTDTYKILVVDDEPDLEPLVLQRMRRQIRSKEYEFVFACDGVDALEKLNADPTIDMVLSDINMPKMDGLTLLQQLPDVDPNLRAVIVSAYGDMDNIRTAMNRGAFDFVTKPIDFDDLKITIARTLDHLAEWREALASRDQLVALQNELSIASQLQQSILPAIPPETDGCEVSANMEPARNVGGDFYDYFKLDNEVGLVVADVSDKGIPASMFMMSSRTALKGAAIGVREPRMVLAEVNNQLQQDNPTFMFVTLIYALFNPETGLLTYSIAGHDPPMLVSADGAVTELPLTKGIALGIAADVVYTQESVTLEPGDTVVLFTDGVTEAMNADNQQFGLGRLTEVFEGKPPENATAANETVFEYVRNFAGDAPQSDDITCLTLRRPS
ncbi:MAG: SpoIIE family protein phosphatase [bacterium]|nr:SpoIIE family protein phosphatase [bacterium]MCY3891402.1 SpoIIE family protein phosphatase [bacterium]MCY3961843.1 SpoIIE family protein phosphatase [bacterium]MCY4136364.1 SpoIIE family protein phosphatase [bacterium]